MLKKIAFSQMMKKKLENHL